MIAEIIYSSPSSSALVDIISKPIADLNYGVCLRNVVESELVDILRSGDDARGPEVWITKAKCCACHSPNPVPESVLLQELLSEVLEVAF